MEIIVFLIIVIIVVTIGRTFLAFPSHGNEFIFNVTRLRYASTIPFIKVGDPLILWTKSGYSRILIDVGGYGFIGDQGRLGLVAPEYVSVIQRHLLSDYPLYDAQIENIGEKSCTVRVKLLSRKEQIQRNTENKLAHEAFDRKEKTKLTELFEKPYHPNLNSKPIKICFTLLKEGFKDFKDVKLKVRSKEFYIANIYSISIQLEDRAGQVIAESSNSKPEVLRVIRGIYNGYRYDIVDWEYDSYFDNRISVHISPY